MSRIVHLGVGSAFELELCQDANQRHLGFQQRESHADAMPGPRPERHVAVGVALAFLFGREPVRAGYCKD